MRRNLFNKKIFITGGTGGIGTPLVHLLKERGAEVEIFNRSMHGDLMQNSDALCFYLQRNTPDILINLAGKNDFDYAENQNYEEIIRLNLLSPMKLVQAVLPNMKRRGYGQIVNIGSMTGLIPLPHLSGYVASKAGLYAFSQSLQRELEGTGIFVTHIIPRAVKTKANDGIKGILNQRTGVTHDDPEKVAHRIVKAISNKEKQVRIGFPERIFALLNALFPEIISMGLRKNKKIGEEILNQHNIDKQNETKETTMKKIVSLSLILLSSTFVNPVLAQEYNQTTAVEMQAEVQKPVDEVMAHISELQTDWAVIKYQVTDKDSKLEAIHKLEQKAEQVTKAYPDRAEPKIWEAIILSTDAGIVKGISALGKVKKAKELLEASLVIDGTALAGSAHTSLGSLYYQVPGWPVAFGDNKKAEIELQKAIAMNPDGIDPNFFYGDFLIEQKQFDKAKSYLEKALLAPDRAGRELADAGRRQEIKAALAKIDENVNNKNDKKLGYN